MSLKSSSKKHHISLQPDPQSIKSASRKGSISPAQKFQLIEALEAIREGKLPTNSQFDRFLFTLIKAPGIDKRRQLMSEDGRKLVDDIRAFFQILRKVVKLKNEKEVVQAFVYHVHLAKSTPAKGDLWDLSGASPEKIAEEAKQCANALFTIGKLLVTNSDIGPLVNEIISITRDMVNDTTDYGEATKQYQDETETDDDETPPPPRRFVDKLPGPMREQAQKLIRMPEDKKDHLISQLKLVLAQVQGNEDYQSAVDYVFTLMSEWIERTRLLGEEARESRKVFRQDANVIAAQQEFLQTIENFAGKNLDGLRSSLKVLADDIQEDPLLASWIGEVSRYVKRLLKDPEFIDSQSAVEKGRELLDKGNPLLQDRYKKDFDGLFDELQSFWDALYNDSHFREVGERIKKIHRDLWLNENGEFTLKPHLLKDFRVAILPAILEETKLIPLPRITYTDRDWDVVLENIVIASENFMPNIIEGKIRNTFRFSPKSEIEDFTSHGITLKLEQIQAFVNNIKFFYSHKRGFPKIKDSGVADILIGGKGIVITLKLAYPSENEGEAFSIKKVRVNISNMRIKIRQSRYEAIYNVIHPYVIHVIRRELSAAIERKVYEYLLVANRNLVSVLDLLVGGDVLSKLRLPREQRRRNRETSGSYIEEPIEEGNARASNFEEDDWGESSKASENQGWFSQRHDTDDGREPIST